MRAGADVLVHMVQRQRARRRVPRAAAGEETVLGDVIGLGDPTEVCKPDPFFEQALPPQVIATIRATIERRPLTKLRRPVPDCGAARRADGAQLPAVHCGWHARGARNRHRHPAGPHVRLGGARGAGALGAARTRTVRRDHRRHVATGAADGPPRARVVERREARELHRARRQSAREHSQHAQDRRRIPGRSALRSRGTAVRVAEIVGKSISDGHPDADSHVEPGTRCRYGASRLLLHGQRKGFAPMSWDVTCRERI